VTSVRPRPEVRGLDRYRGRVIRAADWDAGLVRGDDHVAVIGTGASAVRIIPELVRIAASVKVFQHTPAWVLPATGIVAPSAARTAFAFMPANQRGALVRRVALRHLKRQVRDPWLRRQLTPVGRAHVAPALVSNDFYPALQQANCKLITWPIATLSPAGVRTGDGIEHRVDCILFADGTG
jgi:cation diffusion facilitator CzcD-associated flavoprotein CzcO